MVAFVLVADVKSASPVIILMVFAYTWNVIQKYVIWSEIPCEFYWTKHLRRNIARTLLCHCRVSNPFVRTIGTSDQHANGTHFLLFLAVTQIHMPYLFEWWTFIHIFTSPKRIIFLLCKINTTSYSVQLSDKDSCKSELA